MLTSSQANRFLYDFWAKRTRRRISDPIKRDILVPLEPCHPFGGKRPSLEQNYYGKSVREEPGCLPLCMQEMPVAEVVAEGIKTSDGSTHEIDILIFATGFDSFTGGFADIEITGVGVRQLRQKWDGPQGVMSYLGMTVHGFPNMFFTYGPHSPAAYANGPFVSDVQADWIVAGAKKMRQEHYTTISAQSDAEQEWKTMIVDMHKMTLRDDVDSWQAAISLELYCSQVTDE